MFILCAFDKFQPRNQNGALSPRGRRAAHLHTFLPQRESAPAVPEGWGTAWVVWQFVLWSCWTASSKFPSNTCWEQTVLHTWAAVLWLCAREHRDPSPRPGNTPHRDPAPCPDVSGPQCYWFRTLELPHLGANSNIPRRREDLCTCINRGR